MPEQKMNPSFLNGLLNAPVFPRLAFGLVALKFYGQKISGQTLLSLIRRIMLDWMQLRSAVSVSILSELGVHFEKIRENLYQIAEHEFAIAQHQYNSDFSDLKTAHLFVGRFIYAPSVGAAIRIVFRETSEDENLIAPIPKELLLSPECVRYGDILNEAKKNQDRHFSADFLFKYGSGHCVGRSVSVERFTYFFRSGRVEDPDELVYAVSLETGDFRWTLAG